MTNIFIREKDTNKRIRSSLYRKIILEENLIPYVCQICNQEPYWQGKPLSLDLDHIDGCPGNNELSNLRFLCKNCHSQTETFGGKNLKKKSCLKKDRSLTEEGVYTIQGVFITKKCNICNEFVKDPNSTLCKKCFLSLPKHSKFDISKEELKDLIEKLPLTKIAKIFGCSDKTIANKAKKFQIELKPKGFWLKEFYRSNIWSGSSDV